MVTGPMLYTIISSCFPRYLCFLFFIYITQQCWNLHLTQKYKQNQLGIQSINQSNSTIIHNNKDNNKFVSYCMLSNDLKSLLKIMR